MASNTLLEVKGLHHSYGADNAVTDLSFSLNHGEILGLLGPNGAGKSTTLRMLAAALRPSQGSIRFKNAPLNDKATQSKRHIGYLPERPPLQTELTAIEYLSFVAAIQGVERNLVDAAVERVLSLCHLEPVANRLIGHLSSGFKQRVGIAQAIVHEPDLVLLDEPSVGLDPVEIQSIRELIQSFSATHSVILSTHILPEVETLCDRALIMVKGRLVFDGPVRPAESSTRYRLRLASAFTDALKACPGISNWKTLNNSTVELSVANLAVLDDLLALASDLHLGLRELRPIGSDLESVFLSAVQGIDNSGGEETELGA